MNANAPITVRVTAEHISTGIPDDCYLCAVALALRDATGDPEAHVTELGDYQYLTVRSRALIAPAEVRGFIWEFDNIGDGVRRDVLAPFDFTLPAANDPAWLDLCLVCRRPFAADWLDNGGYCEDCREEAGFDDPDD